ncbi:uncharacterized protein KY384_007699 [Bacidia gigantensis]|uniref:uncharacterized protein n=1 Tax=Bacidia gigantensis TaxID=2732470 RepID=UPI001D03EC80|nr:uncharacterized protein KY384_007699 [Bacidia gigantensis]KAG8527547.1 hypothetical protein KY384_007699 [Bacidia gigantensis]
MGPKVPDSVPDEHGRNLKIDKDTPTPNRLVLCLDGTGNSFQGNPSDTNIVKLMDMFDRSAPHQMHYYQPGIGTYTTTGSVNQGVFGRMKNSISQTIDSGLATSFDAHVIAGYRFLMRYYRTGDRIYIFGFSRGAFTARFLSRMISHVGLLSMGNEEMVPFAYKVYQDYEMGLDNPEPTAEQLKQNYERGTNGRAYMERFRDSFCRHGTDDGVKVHFLGLFDTVSSVGTFDVPFTAVPHLPEVEGTAEHVRHAVAIDERRVKFKAALLAQDKESLKSKGEDIKEVWFPGNHGDIGGGWPAEEVEPQKSPGFWERLKKAFSKASKSPARPPTDPEQDKFQLSDIALKWMIDELDGLPENIDHLQWNIENKRSFLNRYNAPEHRSQSIRALMHDTMKIGGGSSFGNTLMWKIMEYLPFIKRWELDSGTWQYTASPLNKGGRRDVPIGAVFHHSLIERLALFEKTYRPLNFIGKGKSAHHHWHLEDVKREPVENGDPRPKEGPFLVALGNQKRKVRDANTLEVVKGDDDEVTMEPVEEADKLYELIIP